MRYVDVARSPGQLLSVSSNIERLANQLKIVEIGEAGKYVKKTEMDDPKVGNLVKKDEMGDPKVETLE